MLNVLSRPPSRSIFYLVPIVVGIAIFVLALGHGAGRQILFLMMGVLLVLAGLSEWCPQKLVVAMRVAVILLAVVMLGAAAVVW